MAQETKSTSFDTKAILIHHGSAALVALVGWALVVRSLPRGAQSSKDRRSDSLLRGGSWPGELSCERVWWAGKLAGR